MAVNNCTMSPEGINFFGWWVRNWTKCCAKHDRRYENKRLTKYQADKLLYRCVKRKSNAFIASVYFTGVTLFGWWAYYNATSSISSEVS